LTVRFRVLELGSDVRDGPWIAVRHGGPGSCYSLHLGRVVQLHKHFRGRGTNDDTCLARAAWQPDDAWHTVVLRVQGKAIAATLDGQPLLEATDRNCLGLPPVPSGGIALSARRWSHSDGHTRVAFDDVEVEFLGR
ncbi:MAG: hypothetical protein ACODAJ_01935, partial [Planctomycetota bacterium]